MSANERRAKFVELAEKRVTKTVKDIRLIGNLSNTGNYSYTQQDVYKIYRTLSEELKNMKMRFENGGGSQEIEFKL